MRDAKDRLWCSVAVALWLTLGVAVAGAEESPEGGAEEEAESAEGPVYTRTLDHGLWDAVLARHVDAEGQVDYLGLLESPGDLQRLDDYLLWLEEADLRGTSEAERIAFWINAYNAIALRALLDHYPVESVLGIAGFFVERRQPVVSSQESLNDIGNNRLRHAYPGEPRVHFALSTLARGAAPLRNEAYRGERLDEQLGDQARRYVRDTTQVRLNRMEIELGPLLEWFGQDFAQLGGVRTFVAAHLPPDLAEQVTNEALYLVYGSFDWRLNDASEERPPPE